MSKVMPVDESPKCPFISCAAGMGLAGKGVCIFDGDWDNPECPKFENEEDFIRRHEEKPMKKFEITEESLMRAKDVLRIQTIKNNFSIDSHDMILAFMNALCVPVEEPEGWVDKTDGQTKIIKFSKFSKRHYDLWGWDTKPHWYLYFKDEFLQCHKSLNQNAVKEAKAWADEQILLYEEKQKIAPYFCTCSPQKDCPVHGRKQPRPFGIGSRLRAANGDELVVIKNEWDRSQFPFYSIVNLTTYKIPPSGPKWWHKNIDDLKKNLLDSGATIIED